MKRISQLSQLSMIGFGLVAVASAWAAEPAQTSRSQASFVYYRPAYGEEAFVGGTYPIWQSDVEKYHLDVSSFPVSSGLIPGTEDALKAIQRKLEDPATTKLTEQTGFYPRARVDYDDSVIKSTTLIDSNVKSSGMVSYTFNGQLMLPETHYARSLMADLVDEQGGFACGMYFQPNLSYLSEQGRRFFALSAGLEFEATLAGAKTIQDCLKVSIQEYLDYAAAHRDRPSKGNFELLVARRLTKATGWAKLWGSDTFETMDFYIELQTLDPAALKPYIKAQ